MVVSERVIHVRDIEIVPICDCFRAETSLVDSSIDPPNSNSASLYMGLLVEFPNDSRGLLGHLIHTGFTLYLKPLLTLNPESETTD